MYVILFLASQLIFAIGISQKAIDRPALPLHQETWVENVLDLVNDINKVTSKILIFSTDWEKVNETIEVEKNKLIEKNKINFELIWFNWNNDHRSHSICEEHKYGSHIRSNIEHDYKIVQLIIAKPLDMHKDNIEDTLESLKTQITILKELFPFKLRNCNNETECIEERTWALKELNKSRMALRYLQDRSIDTLEVLRNVSYNMYKLKYTTKKDLFELKNKFTCCSTKQISCKNISAELDRFEPLNFKTLELKSDLETPTSTNSKEETTQKEQETEKNFEVNNQNPEKMYNPYYIGK